MSLQVIQRTVDWPLTVYHAAEPLSAAAIVLLIIDVCDIRTFNNFYEGAFHDYILFENALSSLFFSFAQQLQCQWNQSVAHLSMQNWHIAETRHDTSDKTPPGMARALLRAHQSSQNKAFFKKEGSEARYFVTLYKPTEKTSDLNSITHRFAPSCIQGVITSYSFLTGPSLMHPMKAFVGRHVHQYCMKRLKLLRIVKGI